MNYPEPKTSRFKALLSSCIKTAIAAGLIYWLIKSGSIRLEFLYVSLDKLPALLTGCIVLLIGLSLSAFRFKDLLKGAGAPVNTLKCLKITSIMYFFSQCVLGPASGDFARYYYTVKETEKGAQTGAAIMADRIIGTMGLFGLSGLGIILNWSLVESSPELRTVAVPLLGLLCGLWLSFLLGIISLIKGRCAALYIGIPILVSIVTMCYTDRVSFLAVELAPMLILVSILSIFAALIAPEFLEKGWIYKKLFSGSKVGSKIGQLVSALLLYRNCPLIFLKTVIITAVQHFLLILSLYFFSQAQNLPAIPNFYEILFAAPIAFLAGIIPAPAAGLGVNEAAFETLLSLASSGTISAGASIYLMMRIWTTLFSLSGIPFLLREKRKRVAN
ncbi:lysylphosphatidylglycerol synthase domain-containing protein [Maridesulfovibrio ferrireducens]|uniref:lysylphosphatidylglycerol synthase transmembrane domain-containing protein n=1 Tax=Maridesulfovibrio ferrireducens TaxID=246191 RepID=UPI001A204F65|nr:lysylphosphatidylglycerol synthase domain-containing protein [Maridesulfovibrio ferrireducens]MBI9111100.1 flippase-like domain-containing protein [Maridesulfovibrio ferrireducens]